MSGLNDLDRSVHAIAYRRQARDREVVPAKRPQPNLQELVCEDDCKVLGLRVVPHAEVHGRVGFVVSGYELELAAVDAPRRARRRWSVEASAGRRRLRLVVVAARRRVRELEVRRGLEGQGREEKYHGKCKLHGERKRTRESIQLDGVCCSFSTTPPPLPSNEIS